MEVKVIEPIKNYIKEFNTPVEFNLWYAKHKDEVDALTTHKRNIMYHIEGYRITKIKGELINTLRKKLRMKNTPLKELQPLAMKKALMQK